MQFCTVYAEVVAADQADIETETVVGRDGIVDEDRVVFEVELRIFGQHRSQIDADIAGAVASGCRRSDCGGRNRSKQEFTHEKTPFWPCRLV
jgi:hypothetical protein